MSKNKCLRMLANALHTQEKNITYSLYICISKKNKREMKSGECHSRTATKID